MSIVTGSRLGPYEIIAPIGAGGMGEVYRARDTRLDRDVAIKVLPQSFAADADRLARFEREAKALAALNDPQIAQIHGVEESDSIGPPGVRVRALVMEYVAGETLTERLRRGPIPVDEAVVLAAQLARGLAAAHDNGIIHRDLKPSNIKVTDDGKLKVLDFGLAKALTLEASGSQDSPTFTTPAHTHAGVILGTAAYMSPEQARGRPVDRRSDIWAFGCVLYEMLTARPAFAEPTVTDTLAAIITRPPDWKALPPGIPPNVQWLLRRCIERDQRRRLRDIGDAALALDDPDVIWSGGATARAPGIRRSRIPLWAAAAAVLPLAAILAYLGRPAAPGPGLDAPRPVRQFVIQAPYLRADALHRPVISPDGRRIAWSASGSLWVREMATGEARIVAQDVDPTYVAWSSSSDQLCFVSTNQVMRVPAAGGGLTTVADIKFRRGAPAPGMAWLADGQIVFASAVSNTGVETVPARGGSFRTLLGAPPDVNDFHSPSAIPGEAAFLVVADRLKVGTDTIGVYRNGRYQPVFVLAGGRLDAPAYSPSGHLLFERQVGGRGIWAVAFSLDTLEAQGDPFQVAADGAWPSVSADGTLIYTRGDTGSNLELAVMSASDLVPRRVGQPLVAMSQPRVSPDGRTILVSGRDDVGNRDLYVVDVASGARSRLTSGLDPVSAGWAPGNRVLFVSHGGNSPNSAVSVVAADGSGTVRTVIENAYNPALTPDHSWLIFNRYGRSTGSDVYRVRIDPVSLSPASGAVEEPVLNTATHERTARVDRTGSLLAYESEETGRRELYVTAFPRPGEKAQVSTSGLEHFMWDPAADRLLYVQEGRLFEAAITRRPTLSVGRRREVFDERPTRVVLSQTADITSDGRTFVVVQQPPMAEAALGAIVVVENWAEKLRGERPR